LNSSNSFPKISCCFKLELEKAIALFEKQKAHDQLQIDNYQRYQKLRNQRREQGGLS
jgi:hypothetical protein